jgi:hypothetical protein
MKQTSKEPYRVLNWPQYNRALINRGAIELWIEEETLKNWFATDSGPRRAGRPRIYSNAAIQAILLMRIVFDVPYRAITGMMASLFRMMGVTLVIPHYTTLSRRLATLPIDLPGLSSPDEPLVLAIDSTGFKIYGEGEWKVRGIEALYTRHVNGLADASLTLFLYQIGGSRKKDGFPKAFASPAALQSPIPPRNTFARNRAHKARVSRLIPVAQGFPQPPPTRAALGGLLNSA